MSAYLPSADLSILPSVDQFLLRLETALTSDRKNVIAILPDTVPPRYVWEHLRDRLWRRSFGVEEINLASITEAGGISPVAAMGELLRVVWPSEEMAQTVDKLFRYQREFPEIVYWDELDFLSMEDLRQWLAFQYSWADISHTSSGAHPSRTVICAIVPARAVEGIPLKEHLLLEFHWWWGVPTSLEAHLHCRMHANDAERNAMTIWREYILTELAGSDSDVMQRLWDEVDAAPELLYEKLCQIGQERGWSRELLRNWGAGNISIFSLRQVKINKHKPLPEWRVLWARGALYCTDEHGIELHPVALAMLERKAEFYHRLWRAQAALLLPLIDQLRLLLCDCFTKHYGSDWPLRWLCPESGEEIAALQISPSSCQWGHMKCLIYDDDALLSEKQYKQLIWLAHSLRTALAHYRPVEFERFNALWLEMKKLSL